ncbi:hypothetical protein PLICRDRAFT_90072 [Plicaturopsis crispa FD-325 SS-3]|nr:hypothetical protein PLICRDRAFT_90072 [Plicaturopsis crispa FD-325 SS-3]
MCISCSQTISSARADASQTITGLIVSDLSLSYLGYLLSLFTYFRKPEDPDAPPSKSKWIEPYIALSDTTRRQLSLALKATIGWYYHADPEAADAWGEAWLRPVVMRVHDILTERPGFTPVLPADAKPDSLERHAASLSGASSPPPSEPMPKTLCEFFDRMDLSSGPDSTASRDTSEKRRAPVIKLKTLAEPGLAVPSTEAESKPEPPAEAASTTASEKDGLAAMTRWLKKMGLGDEVKYSHQARGTSAPPDSAPAPPVVSSTLSSHEESGPTTGQEDAPAPVPAESTPVTVDSARPKLQSSETSEGIANLTNWLKKMGLGEEVRYAPSANRETPAAVTCSPSESLDSSTPSPDSLQRSKDAPSESARGSTPFPKAEVAGGDRPKWLPIGATTDNSRRSPPTSPPLPSSTASKDDNPTKVTKGKAAVVETPASFVPRQLRSPAVTVPAA